MGIFVISCFVASHCFVLPLIVLHAMSTYIVLLRRCDATDSLVQVRSFRWL